MNQSPHPDVLSAELDGEAVLLNMQTKNYHQLNETAAVIWSLLRSGSRVESIAAELCERFDVDPGTAAAAVRSLVAELEERHLLLNGPTTTA